MAAMNQAGASLGKPVVPNSVLCQIIKYLPELQRFNEELLEDLTSRLKNWYETFHPVQVCIVSGTELMYCIVVLFIVLFIGRHGVAERIHLHTLK